MSSAQVSQQWTVTSGKVATIAFSEEPPINGADATCQWKVRAWSQLFKAGYHVVTTAPAKNDDPILYEIHKANAGDEGKVFARYDEGLALLMRQLCTKHPLADTINQETSGLNMVAMVLAHAGVTPLVLATFHARHMMALGFAKGGEKEPSKRFEHLLEQTRSHHAALLVVIDLQKELLPPASDVSLDAQDKHMRHMTMRQLQVPECLRVAILASKVQTDAVLRTHANVMRAVAEHLTINCTKQSVQELSQKVRQELTYVASTAAAAPTQTPTAGVNETVEDGEISATHTACRTHGHPHSDQRGRPPPTFSPRGPPPAHSYGHPSPWRGGPNRPRGRGRGGRGFGGGGGAGFQRHGPPTPRSTPRPPKRMRAYLVDKQGGANLCTAYLKGGEEACQYGQECAFSHDPDHRAYAVEQMYEGEAQEPGKYHGGAHAPVRPRMCRTPANASPPAAVQTQTQPEEITRKSSKKRK